MTDSKKITSGKVQNRSEKKRLKGEASRAKKPRERIRIRLEQALYLAATDTGFRNQLLENRTVALKAAGIVLNDIEVKTLATVSNETLNRMIAAVKPQDQGRRKFMQTVAASTAALASGTVSTSCDTKPGAEKDASLADATEDAAGDSDIDADTDMDADSDMDSDTDTDADVDHSDTNGGMGPDVDADADADSSIEDGGVDADSSIGEDSGVDVDSSLGEDGGEDSGKDAALDSGAYTDSSVENSGLDAAVKKPLKSRKRP